MTVPESAAPKPDLAVVIGFRDWGLPRLVLALEAHAHSDFAARLEVIVSDYGSKDREEVEQVAQRGGARYVYTEVDGPWSRSRALNAGIAASEAAVVITTDADLLFTPALHGAAYARLQDDPRSIQLVQCRDLSPGFHVDAIDEFDWEAFEAHSTFRPRWGMGGMIAFRRECLLETAGYDERMEIYSGEDLDFARRLAWAGHRLSWIDDPATRIYHVWHSSSRTAANQTPAGRLAIERNRSIYLNDKTVVRNVRRPAVGPLASVAIATHNRAEYLEQALQSVLAQPIEDIEVVIVDDGSTDQTADVVRDLGDSRLRYVRQDNGGVPSARNRAVAETRSKFVIVHDDDDIFLPWRIEAHFDALTVGAHGTYGGWVDFSADGALAARSGKSFSADAILYAGGVLLHPTLMLRKEILERFTYDESLRAGSDYNLVTRLATSGVKLNHTGEFHILRRLHESNITHTTADHQQESARRTTNLMRRRLHKAEEDAARAAARGMGPVVCRGAEDVAGRVGPYLPDDLVRRTIRIDEADAARAEEARQVLVGLGAKTSVPWAALHRLRALGVDFTVGAAGEAGAAPADQARAPADEVEAAAMRDVVGQAIAAIGRPGKTVAVALTEADTPAAEVLWDAAPEFQRLVAADGRQFVAVGSVHEHIGDAVGAVSGFERFSSSVRSVVVDLSNGNMRAAIADGLIDEGRGISQEPGDAAYRERLTGEVREAVEQSLPATAHVAVVSRGDDDLLDLDGRHAQHFPQVDGTYAGHHPGDSTEAIGFLRSARAAGVEYLLIPPASAWWLDYYEDFRRHLERLRCVYRGDEGAVIFDIREPLRRQQRVVRALREVIRRHGS